MHYTATTPGNNAVHAKMGGVNLQATTVEAFVEELKKGLSATDLIYLRFKNSAP